MAEPNPSPAPPDVRLLRSITLRNILSFGPDTPPLELRALNVLIGPNGSGKSNLLDAVELLKKAPDAENLRGVLGAGEHWIWKGKPKADEAVIIIEAFSADYFENILHEIEMNESAAPTGKWLISEKIESKSLLYPIIFTGN